MDPSDTHARVIVLAGQGLCAEELAARCAGPQWDVVAYSDAYAAAVELLRARRMALVYAAASIRPWQKPLIAMARRRGISVLAVGEVAPADRAHVHIVRPEDLGEYITAALLGHLDEPMQAATPPAPPVQPVAPAAGRKDTARRDAAGTMSQPSAGDDVEEELSGTDYEETAAGAARQGEASPPAESDEDAAPPHRAKTPGGEARKANADEESIEPSVSQLLTPDEIAALLKSDP
jgi:hypothetical protein